MLSSPRRRGRWGASPPLLSPGFAGGAAKRGVGPASAPLQSQAGRKRPRASEPGLAIAPSGLSRGRGGRCAHAGGREAFASSTGSFQTTTSKSIILSRHACRGRVEQQYGTGGARLQKPHAAERTRRGERMRTHRLSSPAPPADVPPEKRLGLAASLLARLPGRRSCPPIGCAAGLPSRDPEGDGCGGGAART